MAVLAVTPNGRDDIFAVADPDTKAFRGANTFGLIGYNVVCHTSDKKRLQG